MPHRPNFLFLMTDQRRHDARAPLDERDFATDIRPNVIPDAAAEVDRRVHFGPKQMTLPSSVVRYSRAPASDRPS